LLWPQLFQAATETDRSVWLDQARTSGILYAHQMANVDGRPSTKTLLADLLAGRAGPLPPPNCGALGELTFFDEQLDDEQRQAVRAALAADDVFLLQGLPGTGKSRVLAELAAQAAARGWKVLLTAPSALSLDRFFHHLRNLEHVLAVRWLDPHEDPAHLPESVREHTLPGRAERLKADSLAAAEAEIAARTQEREVLQQELRVVHELRSVVAEVQGLERRREELLAQRQQLPAGVAAEAEAAAAGGPADPALAKTLETEQLRHLSALQEVDKHLAEAGEICTARQQDLSKWQAQAQAQAEIMDARRQWRYFSLKFWRGLLQGRASQRLAEFRCRETEAASALAAARQQQETLHAQRAIEVARNATAREQILAAEAARRQVEVDQQLNVLLSSQEDLAQLWNGKLSGLRATAKSIPSLSAPAHQSLIQLLEARCAECQRLTEFAVSWKTTLAELRPDADALIVPYVNLLAVTTGGFQAAPTHPLLAQDFDVVLIDQADRLGASDLETLAARGRRCVLSGHPPAPFPGQETGARGQLPHTAFHQLWQRLHVDLDSLSCQWLQDGNALICQLVSLDAEQRAALESERLVDQADVELRILNLPDVRPILAEVVFADGFNIQSAKAYLYQQLGELTLRPAGGRFRWRQQGSRLVLDLGLPAADALATIRVTLEDGICELVQPIPARDNGKAPVRWTTAGLEFDCSQGWTRQRAGAWLSESLGLTDPGRTAALETNHRAQLELATFVAGILGELHPVPRSAVLAPPAGCVRLVHLKSTAGPKGQQQRVAKPRPPNNGSGLPPSLELDLSDARQRQRMPLELQLKLPMRGHVNLVEAEQVIRLLQGVAADRNPNAAAAASPLDIAVLSWQLPQVQLLEHLWARAARPGLEPRVRFHTVSSFRDGEADIVLLSLTRSHEQRPLPFAEQVSDWRLALGGARRQLIVIGDLDTLQRRGQVQGQVGRQSNELSTLEREVCARLAQHGAPAVRASRQIPACEGAPT
jgi:hypothetical protein